MEWIPAMIIACGLILAAGLLFGGRRLDLDQRLQALESRQARCPACHKHTAAAAATIPCEECARATRNHR